MFRGARPQAVPVRLARTGVPTVRLTQSFRWRSDGQRELARQRRAGATVLLPVVQETDGAADLDVVLALLWRNMWELSAVVLPLAFHTFRGNGYEEAAATLLLNHVTRGIVGLDATYLSEALTAPAVTDHDVPRQLEPALREVLEILQPGNPAAVKAAYLQLIEIVGTVSPRVRRRPHKAHTGRFELIQQRLVFPGRPVTGLTTH